MQRFQTYGPRDTRDTPDGDDQWLGIDMTRGKPLVQPGYLSLGENTRLRSGSVTQRAGTDQPQDFNLVNGLPNFIVGSGIFRDPNSNEIMLVAPAGVRYTYAFQYGKDPFRIDYDAAVTGDNGVGFVEFAQSFDKIQLFRTPPQGSPLQNLMWDGTPPVAGVSPTKWLVTTLSPDGYKLVPGGFRIAEPWANRIVYYNPLWPTVPWRDQWIISDIQDYTSYDDVYQVFRTNTGESDYITRIKAYFRQSLLIFKNQSIHMATSLNTFPFSIEQKMLTNTLGSIGHHMPIEIGGDVIFLSQPNGFYRLSEIIQEQIITLPVAISEKIQPVIDDINWPYTGVWGCSASLKNLAFFGVVRGAGAIALNTILVYDTQNREWVSAGDTWADPNFQFHRLLVTTYNGASRLFALDYTNGVVYLLYEGVEDNLRSGAFGVPYAVESRGYVGNDPLSFKRFGRASIGLAMYDAEVRVTAITDGVNERKELALITKDRTRFYQHGHKAFDPNTDDPTEQKREDYSITAIDNVAIEDFEELPEGEIAFLPGTSPPIVSGDKQETLERLLVRSNGRWCAIRVENSSGQCDLLALGVESTPAITTVRTAA